jgi:hypothetical protein
LISATALPGIAAGLATLAGLLEINISLHGAEREKSEACATWPEHDTEGSPANARRTDGSVDDEGRPAAVIEVLDVADKFTAIEVKPSLRSGGLSVQICHDHAGRERLLQELLDHER